MTDNNKIPNDPAILLSYVNLKLRDNYSDLDKLCEDLNADKEHIIAKLAMIGYEYDDGTNQFT